MSLKNNLIGAVLALGFGAGCGQCAGRRVVEDRHRGRRARQHHPGRCSTPTTFPTTDRIQLGGTPVVRKAITAGEIDIYPEYTGNAALLLREGRRPAVEGRRQGL